MVFMQAATAEEILRNLLHEQFDDRCGLQTEKTTTVNLNSKKDLDLKTNGHPLLLQRRKLFITPKRAFANNATPRGSGSPWNLRSNGCLH